MASHAANKAERKARILRAARALIRRTGSTGLSMRALAAEAGVSLATPYNLFGSKDAVLKALVDADLEDFRQDLSLAAAEDPIERIFEAIALAAKLYAADEGFYRALFRALFETGNAELRAFYGPDRYLFWEGLLRQAVCAGLLLAETEVAALARTIRYLFAGVLHGWVTAEGDACGIEAEIGYGVSLALCAAATPATAMRLRARLHAYQGCMGAAPGPAVPASARTVLAEE